MCVSLKLSSVEQEIVPAANRASISVLCIKQSEQNRLYTPKPFPTQPTQFFSASDKISSMALHCIIKELMEESCSVYCAY